MRNIVCILAVLGMVGMAGAAEHWRGAGWGGDGTSWNQTANWDDTVPWNTSWDVNVTGEQGTPSNHVINVNQSGTVSGGTVANQAGYTVTMTLLSGITLTTSSPNGLTWNGAGSLTIKPNAMWDMRYGQLALENSGLTTVIEDEARLFCSTLRHNNGTKMDVYGLLEAWSVGRISADPGYRLNVYDGGEFVVYSAVPTGGWSKGGLVTMFLGSTVTLYGDHSAPSDYLTKVQAGEAGTWQVEYSGGWTTIQLVPEPASLLLLGLSGLTMIRRRKA